MKKLIANYMERRKHEDPLKAAVGMLFLILILTFLATIEFIENKTLGNSINLILSAFTSIVLIIAIVAVKRRRAEIEKANQLLKELEEK